MVLERAVEDQIAEVMYKPKITKGVADRTIREWFGKDIVKAPDLRENVSMTEIYMLHIPFWRYIAQGKAIACGYSEYTEQTGNVLRNNYKQLIDEEFIWTECACDTGKHGVEKLWLDPGGEVPFDYGKVAAMMPEGSAIDANKVGRAKIIEMIDNASAKRIQTLTLERSFLIPKVFEIVYAPIWIAHYEYQGGNFTVLLDAVNGKVLGGTAPINMTARLRMMILSLAAGGIMIGTSLAMLIHAGSHPISELFQVILFLLGIALTMAAYPAFKNGRTYVSSGTMKNISHLRPSARVPKQLRDHDILNRESKILRCPVCGELVEQPWGEVISVCKKCSRLLNVTADEVTVVPYDVATPDALSKAAMETEPEYIPFWQFDVHIEVTDKLVMGDTETGLPDISGVRHYYICAGDYPRYLAESWEVDLTIRNPIYDILPEFQEIELKPVYINQHTAKELTEFLYLRYEEEKPGILQVLRYGYHVEDARILFIPYYLLEKTYIPGI